MATRKKSCNKLPVCKRAGRELRKKNKKAGRVMNEVCKPEKKKRKKRGCLNGTGGKSKVAIISAHAKKTRKRGEIWTNAIKRATRELKKAGKI